MNASLRARALASVSLVLLGACCSSTTREQLERVAKDWSEVIRASQVIPVYPLTEDLQPGDLFLVQTPIDRQQEIWNEDGYLPLDNHLARLDPDYDDFYDHSFPHQPPPSQRLLPHEWMQSTAGPPVIASWSKAPAAAFPSYAFEVKKSGGLNLAIPISGVPVGLGLLGASAAQCTVKLSDARTIGLDTLALHSEVDSWARVHRTFLANFGTGDEEARNYVRVVSRVYLLGSIDVSIRSAETKSGGIDAGAPKPVELLTLDSEKDQPSKASQYTSAIGEVNQMLKATADALPGGSLRLTSASSRSVSMRETFPRPLVVGYLGFDYPILTGGALGRPIPTHAALDANASTDVESFALATEMRQTLILDAYTALRQAPASAAADAALKQRYDSLGALVDLSTTIWTDTRDGLGTSTPTASATPPDYFDFRSYRGELERSLAALLKVRAGTISDPGNVAPKDVDAQIAIHESRIRVLDASEESLMQDAVDYLVRVTQR